jgi:hypothetical protein
VSAAADSCDQLNSSRWVMIRIHTPASDRRHNASETPGSGSMCRKMRSSVTAARWAASNCSKVSPHCEYASMTVCGGSESGSRSNWRTTDARNAPS